METSHQPPTVFLDPAGARPGQLAWDAAALEVLRLYSQGKRGPAIAEQLNINPRTVRRHLRGICDDLDVQKPIQAVVWAARNGLLWADPPRVKR